MHVVRKQRVETYLEPEQVEQVIELAQERGTSSSDVIRAAVMNELEEEGYDL